jgi:hypothetical protein
MSLGNNPQEFGQGGVAPEARAPEMVVRTPEGIAQQKITNIEGGLRKIAVELNNKSPQSLDTVATTARDLFSQLDSNVAYLDLSQLGIDTPIVASERRMSGIHGNRIMWNLKQIDDYLLRQVNIINHSVESSVVGTVPKTFLIERFKNAGFIKPVELKPLATTAA